MATNLNNIKANAEVSQNDMYGHTELLPNKDSHTNESLYKRMKNKISYGSTTKGLKNNGARRMVK